MHYVTHDFDGLDGSLFSIDSWQHSFKDIHVRVIRNSKFAVGVSVGVNNC